MKEFGHDKKTLLYRQPLTKIVTLGVLTVKCRSYAVGAVSPGMIDTQEVRRDGAPHSEGMIGGYAGYFRVIQWDLGVFNDFEKKERKISYSPHLLVFETRRGVIFNFCCMSFITFLPCDSFVMFGIFIL